MQDFGTKTDNSPPPGGQLSAAEFNNLATENENAVLRSGLALSGASDTQLAQSVFLHSVKAGSFQDSGLANAYVATPVSGASGVLLPGSYVPMDGAVIGLAASNTNTLASTLNIGQTTGTLLGTKKILDGAGVDIAPGAIVAGAFVEFRYSSALDGGVGAWVLLPWSKFTGQTLPTGYFTGFQLANNVSLPNTTVDVGAGSARNSTDTVDVRLSATIRGILQAAGAWAAGDNQNKLDAGAKAINTWYHVFAIRKTSDGTGDILYSTSVSAPVLPSGYAGFVLIESIRTDGSGNILPFVHSGCSMTWKTARQDVNLAAVAPGNSTVTCSSPPGRRVMVKQYAAVSGNAATVYTHAPDVNNETLAFIGGGWKAGISTNNAAVTDEVIGGYLECLTGTSSDIVMQTYTAGGNLVTSQLATMGWEKV